LINRQTIDALYQGYLTKVYQHTHGYVPYSAEEQRAFKQTNVCYTYGELLYPSVKKMLDHIKITENDIFLDLGSGLGKCALQIFMQTVVKKVIGIEAASVLLDQAKATSAQVKSDFPFFWEGQRDMLWLNENFLQSDWQGATLVYTCSTCFTEALLVEIGDKINREVSVRQVLSLRPLPTLTRLRLKEVFSVECSWDTALCFHYGLL
jgi:hypothetical protein